MALKERHSPKWNTRKGFTEASPRGACRIIRISTRRHMEVGYSKHKKPHKQKYRGRELQGVREKCKQSSVGYL